MTVRDILQCFPLGQKWRIETEKGICFFEIPVQGKCMVLDQVVLSISASKDTIILKI